MVIQLAGELVGQHQGAGFALHVVVHGLQLDGVTGAVETHSALRGPHVDHGADPDDTHAAGLGGRGRVLEHRLEQACQEEGAEAVGAEFEIIALNVSFCVKDVSLSLHLSLSIDEGKHGRW